MGHFLAEFIGTGRGWDKKNCDKSSKQQKSRKSGLGRRHDLPLIEALHY